MSEVQPIKPPMAFTNLRYPHSFKNGTWSTDTRFFKDKFYRVDTFEINGQPKKVKVSVFENPLDSKPIKYKWKTKPNSKQLNFNMKG